MKNKLCRDCLVKFRAYVVKLRTTGFFSIFITNILTKAIGLLGGVLLVRILSKEAYGVYAYVLNAYGILCLLADMGTGMTSVQMCSEAYNSVETRDAIFSYAFRNSMFFMLLSAVAICGSCFFYPFKGFEFYLYTVSLFLLPFITNINRFILNNAQIHLQNRVYASISLFSSLIRYVFLLPLACLFSFKGALYSDYLIQLMVMIYGIKKSRGFLRFKSDESAMSGKDRKIFWHLSVASAVNNLISNSLVLCDIFLLGLLISDLSVIASYKVASAIPVALMFIPTAVDTYLLPRFSRRRTDNVWVRKYYFIGLSGLCAFNFCLCVGAFVFGNFVIKLIYGALYADATECFIILMIGYFFASVRYMSAMVLNSQRRVYANVVVVIFANVTNVALDALLIPKIASRGAAWASTLMNILAAIFMVMYLLYILRNQRESNAITS